MKVNLVPCVLLAIGAMFAVGQFYQADNVFDILNAPCLTQDLAGLPYQANEGTLPATSNDWPGVPARHLSTVQTQKGLSLVRIAKDDGSLGPMSEIREFFDNHLDEFLHVYKNRPDKYNLCGIRINHSLAVYMIAKKLQPTTIIESGVNSGQSTYFFRQACPNAKIISIDPEMKPICGQPVRWIDETNNEYLTGDKFIDFNQVDWGERIQRGEIDPEKTLMFVDDHRGFFLRFPTFLKFGFRHLINEDNYKFGEGATRQDKMGLTPKQMFMTPNKPDSQWLFHNIKVYAEFPPLVPPSLARNTTHPKKMQGGFLHPTDALDAIEAPILRPDINKQDRVIYEKIAATLNYTTTLDDSLSYQEFMGYCFICYMELVPFSPAIKEAWGLK